MNPPFYWLWVSYGLIQFRRLKTELPLSCEYKVSLTRSCSYITTTHISSRSCITTYHVNARVSFTHNRMLSLVNDVRLTHVHVRVLLLTRSGITTLTHVLITVLLAYLSSHQVLYQTHKQQLFFLSFPSWVSSVNYKKKAQ